MQTQGVPYRRWLFLSTPSARRATQQRQRGPAVGAISIHALREEGDGRCSAAAGHPPDFYPRPPRGGRPKLLTGGVDVQEFLSTPSARRATYEDRLDMTITCQFLSTPSARRATGLPCRVHRRGSISIHALREEGDAAHSAGSRRSTNFYPRPPRGGRPPDQPYVPQAGQFLSTPSARRATGGMTWQTSLQANFYPRPPRGGRRGSSRRTPCMQLSISIHALREEGD